MAAEARRSRSVRPTGASRCGELRVDERHSELVSIAFARLSFGGGSPGRRNRRRRRVRCVGVAVHTGTGQTVLVGVYVGVGVNNVGQIVPPVVGLRCAGKSAVRIHASVAIAGVEARRAEIIRVVLQGRPDERSVPHRARPRSTRRNL